MKTRMPASLKVGASPSLALAPLGSLQRACTCGARAGLDGQCAACRHERLIGHGHASDRTRSSEAPPLVADVLRSPGRPIDSASRTLMEARFSHHVPHLPVHAPKPAPVMNPIAIGPAGSRSEQEAAHTAERAPRETGLPGTDAAVSPISYDFSQVRIHTDARAAASAESINALAYSYGRDIAFATGQYRPETMAGRELLAHELTHVLQAPQHPATVQRKKRYGNTSRRSKPAWQQAAEAELDTRLKAGEVLTRDDQIEAFSRHAGQTTHPASPPVSRDPYGVEIEARQKRQRQARLRREYDAQKAVAEAVTGDPEKNLDKLQSTGDAIPIPLVG